MFIDDIHRWARTQPDKCAVIHNDRAHSYKNFANYIDYARSFLASRKVQRGGTVAIMINNLLVSWSLLGALRALGCNTISVQSLEQLATLKVRNLAAIVMAKSENKSSSVPSHVIVFPDADMFKARSRPLTPYAPVGSDCGGHILYTSGTTGTYKKVFYAQDKAERGSDYVLERFGLKSETIFHILYFPIFTIAGFAYPLAIWIRGGCVVIDQRDTALLNLYQHSVNMVFVVPSMLDEWLSLADQHQCTPTKIEIWAGGGYVSLSLAERARLKLSDSLSIVYGASECLGMMRSDFTSLEDLQWYSPMNLRDIIILDDNGLECPLNVEGELAVQIMDVDAGAYLDDEPATQKYFRNGYFFPGDMAVKRADGRIRILGRVSDVLNLKGWKIAAAPIEQRIQFEIKARGVCVFATLDDKGNDEIAVAIETDKALTEVQIEFIHNQLKPANNIRCVCFNHFPRTQTAMQKLDRKKLRRWVFSPTATS